MSNVKSVADLRRIAEHRRALSLVRMNHRKVFSTYEKLIMDMFDRSLDVEPDGAGLPYVVQAAVELVCVVFTKEVGSNVHA